MSEERLLKDLARLARERDAVTPEGAWDLLASGELTEEQRERLRVQAERSPADAAAWDAFQPLGADFRAALVARVARELREPPSAEPAVEPAPARSTPPRRASRAWLSGWRLALVAALAAAGLLIALGPWARPRELPTYELSTSGALQSRRGPVESATPGATAGAPLPLASGNRFELLLTPATSAGADVESQVLIARGERLEPLALPAPQRSDEGALRYSAVVGRDLELPPGESVLVVVVARPGARPSEAELRARLAGAGRARDARWSAWSLRVSRAPDP